VPGLKECEGGIYAGRCEGSGNVTTGEGTWCEGSGNVTTGEGTWCEGSGNVTTGEGTWADLPPVAGVMIGREAYGRPWMLRSADVAPPPPPPPVLTGHVSSLPPVLTGHVSGGSLRGAPEPGPQVASLPHELPQGGGCRMRPGRG
jgi:hypothetical protein